MWAACSFIPLNRATIIFRLKSAIDRVSAMDSCAYRSASKMRQISVRICNKHSILFTKHMELTLQLHKDECLQWREKRKSNNLNAQFLSQFLHAFSSS